MIDLSPGVVGLISLAITSLTGLGMAYIAMKTAALAKNQSVISSEMTELKKQTNHIKDALVATTAEKSLAEGVLKGRTELQAEQQRAKAPQ